MEPTNTHSTHVDLASFDRTLADLDSKGYKQQFRREPTCLYCPALNLRVTPMQFSIEAAYYFKDPFSPDGDRLLYAISTNDEIKGILVDTDSVYADNTSLGMRQKLISISEIYTVK